MEGLSNCYVSIIEKKIRFWCERELIDLILAISIPHPVCKITVSCLMPSFQRYQFFLYFGLSHYLYFNVLILLNIIIWGSYRTACNYLKADIHHLISLAYTKISPPQQQCMSGGGSITIFYKVDMKYPDAIKDMKQRWLHVYKCIFLPWQWISFQSIKHLYI